METKEIIENNKLIAEFMKNRCYETLKYHSSWDWLMSVVEKIELLEINGYPYIFTMTTCNIFIENPMILDDSYIVQIERTENMMVDIYSAVNDFIKWFNNH